MPNRPKDEDTRAELKGRCTFCGAVLADDAEVCPECDHEPSDEFTARPRRPAWVTALAYVVLALAVLGVVVAVAGVLRR